MAFQYNDNRPITNHTHIDYPLTCGTNNSGAVTWVDFINFRNVDNFGIEPNKQPIGGTWLNVLDKLQGCFDEINTRLNSLDTKSAQLEESLSNVLSQVAPVISKANSSYYYTELLQNTYNVEISDTPPTYTSDYKIVFRKNIGGGIQPFKIYTDDSHALEYKEDLKVLEVYFSETYNRVYLKQFSNYGIKEIIVDVACVSTYENDDSAPSTMSVKILGKDATLPIIKPWNNEPIRYATFRVTSVPDEFDEEIPIISDQSYDGGDTPFYIKISVVCAPDEDIDTVPQPTEPTLYYYVGTTKPTSLSECKLVYAYPAEENYTNNSGTKSQIFVLTNNNKTVTFIEPNLNAVLEQESVDTSTISGYKIFATSAKCANGGVTKIRIS